jgi:hypothetical protein
MLHDLAPGVPIGMTYTMEQQVDSSVGRERLMGIAFDLLRGPGSRTYGNWGLYADSASLFVACGRTIQAIS